MLSQGCWWPGAEHRSHPGSNSSQSCPTKRWAETQEIFFQIILNSLLEIFLVASHTVRTMCQGPGREVQMQSHVSLKNTLTMARTTLIKERETAFQPVTVPPRKLFQLLFGNPERCPPPLHCRASSEERAARLSTVHGFMERVFWEEHTPYVLHLHSLYKYRSNDLHP